MSVPDIVLFPHCDLHVALHGTPPLHVRVMQRRTKVAGDPDQDPMNFLLEEVTSGCTFEFFAPFSAVGSRLDNVPSIAPADGLVTATIPGLYLFQVRFGNHYQVGRLQVHDTILGWWFGNSSITTAVDPRFAHAQPSIYASFSADPSGTDIVGDITGHDYVPLVSTNPGIVVVERDGRLRGVVSAGTPAAVSGTFGASHSLVVHVENYGVARNQLDAIRVPNMAGFATMHNMVFIPEGFRDNDADRKQFDEIVSKVVDEMFTKPRHQPYPLLEGSFNVWKAYFPSQQHALTCGYRVNELNSSDAILAKGSPIPFNGQPKDDDTKYTVGELVRRVGLPRSHEPDDRTTLVTRWGTQSLHDFTAAKVDDDLVKAWKAETTTGILEARDTFFGFRLGSRPGDRISGGSNPVVVRPGADNGDANLQAFVKRVYEFFEFRATRALTPDPRRHPPELLADRSDTNPGNAVLRYLSGLHTRIAPNLNIGAEWQPDPLDQTFRRSRGFIAIICNDHVIGGSNVGNSTMTANTLKQDDRLDFELIVTGAERVMRRKPPDPIDADVDEIINTVAHEFGHSFNLADEYEDFPGNAPDADVNRDFDADNLTRLGWIFANGTVANGHVTFNDSTIDPAKVKWFDLMRIQVSDVLLKNADAVGNVIKLTVEKSHISAWVAAKKAEFPVFLRARDILNPRGQQLPLSTDPAHFLPDLTIGAVDEALGTVLIASAGLPPIASPVFLEGAVLFIPRRTEAPDLKPRFVIEVEVLAHLNRTKTILNDDTDIAKVNAEQDDPVSIPDFFAPCKSYKMIGVYEGAGHFAGRYYRPAGLCKMRKQSDAGKGDGEFCHVCKWLIVNRVNPSLHAILDDKYFPNAKGPADKDPNA